MKYLKALLVVIVTVFTFGSATAQVVVRAQVGHGHHWHHRHWRHRHWRRH